MSARSLRTGRAPVPDARLSRRNVPAGWDARLVLLLTIPALLLVSWLSAARDVRRAPLSQVQPEHLHEPPPAPAYALAQPVLAQESRALATPADVPIAEARPAADPVPPPPPDTAAVEITVRDGTTGRPARASVEVRSIARSEDGAEHESLGLFETDAAGVLLLLRDPGSLSAVAWADGRTALARDVELRGGQRSRLRLVLAPAHPVAGRVVDARNGAPIADAEVAIWTFSERDVVRTAGDGTFRHPRFPRDELAQQICARAPGFGTGVRYLEVAGDGAWAVLGATNAEHESAGAGGTPWVELALVPELVLRGRVVDALRRPVADATVSAEGYFRALPEVAARDAAEARTDATGAFRIEGLRSDIGHGLAIEAPGFAAERIELAPATAHVLPEVVLAGEALCAGTVVDPEGFPVEDLVLELFLEDTESAAPPQEPLDVGARVSVAHATCTTDENGTFVFEGLPARAHRLVARRDQTVLLEHVIAPWHGSLPTDLVLVLEPGCAVLLGQVHDADGAVTGALVEIRRGGVIARVTADRSGRFRVVGLDREAAYELVATAPDDDARRAFGRLAARTWDRESAILTIPD